MKKILLAIALAACSIASQAQSNVSVYGILDVGYMGTNYTGTGTSATTKQTTSAIGQSAEQTSPIAATAASNYAIGIRHTF